MKIGAMYRPKTGTRGLPTLPAVIDWLENPEMLKEKGTLPSTDLVADLLDYAESDEGKGGKLTLIMLWPAEPTDEEKTLVTAARAAGIKVVDLTAALDDLAWDPTPAPPAQAEEVSAVEDVTAKVSAALTGDFGTAIAGLLEQWVRTLVQDEFDRRDARANHAEPAPEPEAPAAAKPARARTPAKAATAAKPAARSRSRATTTKDAVEGVAVPELPLAGEDEPPFDGPYRDASPEELDAQPRYDYYMSEDGEFRRAKGRPRNKETRVKLTQAEIDEARDAGTLADDD